MASWCLILAVCFFSFLEEVEGVRECIELPVFSPPRLVVLYGAPAMASCSICNSSCGSNLRLEESFRAWYKRGEDVVWNVSRFNQWDTFALCYVFNTECETKLEVLVYKPPDSVTLRPLSSSLMEGQSYSLQCDVENVAPAHNMTVVFYRGHSELAVRTGRTTHKSPVNESFTLNYTVSKEDHGLSFWCETTLQLGPGGPQPPPVVRSNNVTANVYYKPYCPEPVTHIETLSVAPGSSVVLNCSCDANPSPDYSWTVPSASHTLYNHSVYTISSASDQDHGQFTCKATNQMGAFYRTFNVNVIDPPLTEGPTQDTPISTTESSNSAVSFSMSSYGYIVFSALYSQIFLFH